MSERKKANLDVTEDDVERESHFENLTQFTSGHHKRSDQRTQAEITEGFIMLGSY